MSTEITPALLWELAPWSWLADWVLHLGDSLRAQEAAMSNRVLTTYAYAMESVEVENHLALSNIRPRYTGSYAGPSHYSCAWTTTSRRRIRANPFGFIGTSASPLTVGQLGILNALSLKKR